MLCRGMMCNGCTHLAGWLFPIPRINSTHEDIIFIIEHKWRDGHLYFYLRLYGFIRFPKVSSSYHIRRKFHGMTESLVAPDIVQVHLFMPRDCTSPRNDFCSISRDDDLPILLCGI